MKKLYYLLAIAMLAFTACQKQPVVGPTSPVEKKAVTFTLQQADYQLLPSSDYPYYTFTFDDVADAQKYIPLILASKYPRLDDGSTASITYTISAPYFKLSDSSYADVAYTLTSADYKLLPGNKYSDFSIAQVLQWLPYKYPSPANNELKLLTFTPYPATLTPPYSFLYTHGAWQLIYTITPAQYTSLGDGKYDQFSSSNDAVLPQYLNALLKADITVSDTVKTGDIEYVSFNYYASNDSTYQRVQPLVYNGNNFVINPGLTNTLSFARTSGVWLPDLTIYYTLTSADATLISNSTIGTSAERTNLGKYGDFSGWAATDLDAALILVLTTDFPNPKVNTPYDVTYLNYTGGADVPTVVAFEYNGTAWALK